MNEPGRWALGGHMKIGDHFSLGTLAEIRNKRYEGLKGAVVGAVAGHYAGRHSHILTGAIAGCYMGHHIAKQKEQQQRQQQPPAHSG